MSDWGRSPARPSLEWEHISTQALATTSATIVFAGFSTQYRHFILAGTILPKSSTTPVILFNQDSTPSYSQQLITHFLQAGGSFLTQAASLSAQASMRLTSGTAHTGPLALLIEIHKASESIPARSVVRYCGRTKTSLLDLVVHAGYVISKWNNVEHVINRIDVVGSSMAAGTRLSLSGARDSLS